MTWGASKGPPKPPGRSSIARDVGRAEPVAEAPRRSEQPGHPGRSSIARDVGGPVVPSTRAAASAFR
jgi:hypothetical protein